MKTRIVRLIVALLAALTGPRLLAQANASPPERLTYQGFLVDGDGVALGNDRPRNYDIEFRLFSHETDSSAASLLWGEQQTVTVDRGYFSVLLGEGTPLTGMNQPLSSHFRGATASGRWIGLTVRGIGANNANVEILPRIRLLSAPYAFLSRHAEQAQKLVRADNGAEIITSSGNTVTVNGTVNAGSFTGNGSGLTSLNAANITSGTLPPAVLGNSVARLTGGNNFSGNQIINSGRIGIRTSDPDAPLTITEAPGLGWLSLKNPAGESKWNLHHRNAGFHVAEAGIPAARFTVAPGGNIGIGHESPPHRLSMDNTLANTKLSLWNGGVDSVYGMGVQSGQFRFHLPNAQARFTFLNGPAGTDLINIHGTGLVEANGGFRARSGRPGSNGINLNGYAFSGDTDSGMFSAGDGLLQFFVSDRESMRISGDGYVGIGTTTPRAPLHVSGYVSPALTNPRYFDASSNLDRPNSRVFEVSIRSDRYVQAAGFVASSDERLKQVIGRSSTRADLTAVQGLKVTDYLLKDVIEHGNRPRKGLLAQEVSQVIPEAVSRSRGFIPDIYSVAQSLTFDADSRTLWVTLSQPHRLQPGDRLRLVTDDKTSDVTVREVPSDCSFIVEDFTSTPARLFVYGREVEDLLSVDYDRVLITTVGAIQELARRTDALEQSNARIAELERKLERMESLEIEVAGLREVIQQLASTASSGKSSASAPASAADPRAVIEAASARH